jgi:hypothetical protein
MTAKEAQIAGAVLMIRPVRFESNPLTAESNRFQGRTGLSTEDQQLRALREFDDLAAMLTDAGINVIVVDDTAEPHTPDSIFPNNWVSFHANGRVVLYPMQAENRRTERRGDIIDSLVERHGFKVSEIIDLSHHEQTGQHLEGTGSMVLDRTNHIAYACLSSRTHLEPLGDFAQRLDYDVVAFDALDRQGIPIYHTNVMMNVGESVAVICAEAIPSAEQRDAVVARLRETGHEVVTLSFDQIDAFAGNMLELRNADGERVIVMSTQAWNSLHDEQKNALQKNARIVHSSIETIESSAGGSVRCMLAEIHLPT